MILFYAISVLTGAPVADPIAPAWSGQVQCYSPDEGRRECSSIGAYRRTLDGKILNEAIVGISKSPNITMTTVAEVQIRQDLICGALDVRDVEGSAFAVEGVPATAEQAELLKQAMTTAMQPLFGREVCVSPSGEAHVNGTRMPQMDQRVRWVPGDAGYTVRMP